MLYVIAKIDKSARARLSWIQSFSASFGVVPRPIYGHITLAAFEGEPSALMAACKAALAEQAAFSVDFRTVEVLREERVIAALAAREGTLAALRERLAAVAPCEENWVPHTALLHDGRMDLNWVRSAMAQMFQPFTAGVERIEFTDGDRVLDALELKGETA